MSSHLALNTMLRGQVAALEARKAIPTTVEYESDPNYPGRTAIRITAATRDAVQEQITRCMNAAQCMGTVVSVFTSPRRMLDGWVSLGEVVVSELVG